MKKTILTYSLLLLVAFSAHAQIGIGTITPGSDLQVAGAVALNVRTVSASTSATATDQVVIFTGTTAATVTLPDATTCVGRIYWIKNASTTLPSPAVTIATTSSQLIDGQSGWLLDEPLEVVRFVSDGTGWQVFSQAVSVRKTTTVGTPWLQGGNKLKSMKSVGAIENYAYTFITDNTPRVHITNNGWMGLGTTTPLGRIHSQTDNDDNANDYIFTDHGTTTPAIYLRKSRGTIVIPSDLQNGDLISQVRFAPRYNNALANNSGSGIDAYYTGTGTSASTDLRFFSTNTEQMRIHQLGYVGIGTSAFDATNPEKLLVDAGVTSSYNVISGKGDIDNYLQLNIRNSNAGNTASSDIVATADNGDETVNYIDLGINSSGYTSALIPILDGVNEAYLYALGQDMKIGNASAGYDLGFFTNAFALANERIRITATGNIGIGTSAPADKLSVAGIFTPSADNTYTMGKSGARWSAVWSANGVIQTSDIRLKKNIQPLHYGLNTVMQMNPVSYRWKTNDNGNKVGLIAQEVKQLVPEVVVGDEAKENLGMNYAELVPVLIKTIQEQQARLAILNKELKQLKK